jgi:diketogulonate reductase-like aldo/keto reductase
MAQTARGSSRATHNGNTMANILAPTVTTHGATMPVIGFGTLDIAERGAALVEAAIRTGYRHIDTARKYGSEEGVGNGIRASGINRDELFITTKVTEDNAREADFMRSAETSLKTLGVSHVDLLLIHWPSRDVPRAETIGALAKAKRMGLTRHIGVSNFTVAMLDEAVRLCPEPLVTNQVEYHPYLKQDKLLEACRRHGLILTAYCPLARGELLNDPVLGAIAKAKGKTVAQVALRWLIQHPMVVPVPRALETAHVTENFGVFDFSLSEDEMKKINALRDRNVRIASPPERAPVWDAA